VAPAQLPRAFFERPVEEVAKDLVGAVLVHDGTSGLIVETESYHQSEAACHAHVGPTARNRVLFGPAGHVYVYLSYGIHSLVNLVTGPDGEAAAVLIRALEPLEGIELMRSRRGVDRLDELCSGPGKLTEALGIGLEFNGVELSDGPIGVFARDSEPEIVVSKRVGITKAVELPWRFSASGSRFVSRPRPPA